ncbi:hypothetical protein [Leucobacter sp. 1207-22]|uniref:hypothetical protein n=1 Tax=Leucobacter sp. 1207-22 TaxID=2604456 RepID=UPI004063640B
MNSSLTRTACAAVLVALLGLGSTAAEAAETARAGQWAATVESDDASGAGRVADTPTTDGETTALPSGSSADTDAGSADEKTEVTEDPEISEAAEPEGSGETATIPTDATEQLRNPTGTESVRAAPVTVDDAALSWGLNRESTGGAYYGGCNFLSAGIAGDAGGSRIWKKDDQFYSSEVGNVSVQRPSADGSARVMQTWENRCQTSDGKSVNGQTNNGAQSTTGSEVYITGGTGTLDPEANTAQLQWKGSFTVAYYGGMTYWSATDPVLRVDSTGAGTLTARLSGFGADMDDPEAWSVLPERTVTLAVLSGVKVSADGLTVTPDFLGVKASAAGRNPQAALTAGNRAWWGSFPKDFIDYHVLTGQSSYWYTTDGGANSIQPRKVALPIEVTRAAVDEQPPTVDLAPETSAVEWTETAIVPEVGGSAAEREFVWESRDPAGEWQTVATQKDAALSVIPALAEQGTEYRVRVTTAFGAATSEPTRLQVLAKKPGSIVPRTGREISDATSLRTIADIKARIADGTVRDVTAKTTGVTTPLGASTARSITVPWTGTADAGEAWLYPGQRYLGTWVADPEQRTATITLRPGNDTEGTSVLGTLQAGQQYSMLFFTHDDPLTHVSFTAAGSTGTGPSELTNAGLRWGINAESTGGAYFGGCNFLSAGAAGDSGSARVWTKRDGFFSSATSSGNVRIEKPTSAGRWEPVTWENKCTDPFGSTVTSSSTESSSGAEIVLTGGSGSIDPATNSAKLRWQGSFTVAFYGGMTYWTASNPELTVRNGVGTLTATGSGFGAEMDDTSVWKELTPQRITLATFSGVNVNAANFTIAPDYLGVSVGDLPGGRNAQPAKTAKNSAFWGSFPRNFIDFQILTGQSSYWYTSDGARDRAKLPKQISVCADSANCAGSQKPPVKPDVPNVTQRALLPPQRTVAPPRQSIVPVSQVGAPLAGAQATKRIIVTTRVHPEEPLDSRTTVLLLLVLLAGLGTVTVVTATGGGLIMRGVIAL